MAKTIIQTIGPLYGEVVNGTVFGRPNGSVFVPATNTISLTLGVANIRMVYDGGVRYVGIGVNSWVKSQVVAESQDIANSIKIEISTTAEFTTSISQTLNAGIFNTDTLIIIGDPDNIIGDIVAKQTYYIRAVLMAGAGVPVASSEVLEVEGV